MIKISLLILLSIILYLFVIYSPYGISDILHKGSIKSIKPLMTFKNQYNSFPSSFLDFFNIKNNEINPKTPSDITSNDFKGDWHSTNNHPPFNYFTQTSGSLILSFDNYNNSLPTTLYLQFIDGKFRDLKVIQINKINLEFFTINTSQSGNPLTWTSNAENCTLEEWESLSLNYEVDTVIRYNLTITNTSAADCNGFKLYLQLGSSDPQMNINIESELTLDNFNYNLQAFLYALSVSIICIIEIIIIYRLIKFSMEDEAMISKMSILTIGWEYITDTYICLLHLWMAIYHPNFFHFFIVPTILYFILASIFEMRFLMFLWKARYYSSFNNLNLLRRGLILFFVKLYITLFVLLILLYFFVLVNWFVIILQMYLIPQIYHTAKSSRSLKNLNIYLLPFTAIRIIIPLYFRGCPINIFLISPSLTFDIMIGCLMAFQIIICLLQWFFGPRCFIPSIFLPPKFNYYFNYTVHLGQEDSNYDDCVICMFPLHEEPQDGPVNRPPSQEQPLLGNTNNDLRINQKTVTKKIMRTPCDHKFHIPCLKRWLNIKLECPTCRKQIPSLE